MAVKKHFHFGSVIWKKQKKFPYGIHSIIYSVWNLMPLYNDSISLSILEQVILIEIPIPNQKKGRTTDFTRRILLW